MPVRREAGHAGFEGSFGGVELGLDRALLVGGLRQLVLERAGVGFRVQGAGFRVEGPGFGVQG